MRMLGIRAGIPVFRWDLVYLHANLAADERPEVVALAAPVAATLDELRAERDGLEQAEDTVVLRSAGRGRRDGALDALLIEYGGVARATDRQVYATSFPRHSPSKTARLALADEVQETGRIVGELAALPAGHVLRVEYHARLQGALGALKAAMGEEDEAATALSLARTRVERFKLRADEARLTTHGQLLTILKDKAEADAFFRPTNAAPGAEAEEPGPAEQGDAAPAAR